MYAKLQVIESLRGAAFVLCAARLSANALIKEYEKAGGNANAIADLQAFCEIYESALNDYGAICTAQNSVITPLAIENFVKSEAALCKVIIRILDNFGIADFAILENEKAKLFAANGADLSGVECERLCFLSDLHAFLKARQIADFVDLHSRAAK